MIRVTPTAGWKQLQTDKAQHTVYPSVPLNLPWDRLLFVRQLSKAMNEQQYEVQINDLGGESIYVPPGTDLKTIPSNFLELLSNHHAAIYEYPREYLSWLARRARLPGMKTWLSAMAAAERCGLYLHRAELGPTLQTDVIVRSFLCGRKGYIDFRLSSNKPLFHLPPPLQDVYELIDGTVEGNAFEASGFNRFALLRFDASSLPNVDRALAIELDTASWFFSTANGDQIFAVKDKAVWFLHEDSSFVEIGNLLEVVDSYFVSNLTGAKWMQSPRRPL